jgi:hypothetical protein
VKAAEADIVTVLKKVSELQDAVEELRKQVVALQLEKRDVSKGGTSEENNGGLGADVNRAGGSGPKCGDKGGACSGDRVVLPERNGLNAFQQNSKKVAEVIKDWENEEWQTVGKRRNTRPTPKFGTKGEGSGGKVLKAAKTKRSWHLYVGNLRCGTTVDDVSAFLSEGNVEVMFIEPVGYGQWDDRPAAFHVEVDYGKKDVVMDESFWDCGVKVRNWTFPRRRKTGWSD